MYLGEVADKYTWREVKKRFFQLYPEQKHSIDGYKLSYKQIQFMSHVRSESEDMSINIERRHSGDELYFGVFGRINEDEKFERYALEFETWERWIGMKISDATLNRFGELDVMCHCLFEMTFHGFDRLTANEKSSSVMEEINQRVEEINKWEDEGTLEEHCKPWEQVKKELNEKFGLDKK